MKTVRYTTLSQWVGTMTCRTCSHRVRAWRSSGMSDCCPHFYCDRCSNAIQREADKELIWDQQSLELVQKIAATLPDCPCGGRFVPGANPKCPNCRAEFKHQNDPVKRLLDRHVILLDGAAFFGDREPYQVEIVVGEDAPAQPAPSADRASNPAIPDS